MSPFIYSLQNNQLRRMTETPFSSEELLQRLLQNHSDLLAGEQIDEAVPRRWLLVAREMPVPDAPGGGDRWAIDHLFLDQDGTPTIVEVKRSGNAQIRREVVGQVLEYAANAVECWEVHRIRSEFEKRCAAEHLVPEVELRRFLDLSAATDDQPGTISGEVAEGATATPPFGKHEDDPIGEAATALEFAKPDPSQGGEVEAGYDDDNDDIEAWWETVETNLRAGRLRLLFVADALPRELCRVIEFLNKQMKPAEVLGVEVRRYTDEANATMTLVPTVRGRTARAKTRGASRREQRERVTVEQFVEAMREVETSRSVTNLALRLIDLTKQLGATPFAAASFIPYFVCGGRLRYPIKLELNGRLWLQMLFMQRYPPFDSPDARATLRSRCERIPGWVLRGREMEGYPRFELAEAAAAGAEEPFLAAMEWFLRSVRDERLAD